MTSAEQVVRKQIRGSTVLIAGRLLGASSNFVAQIMLIRYLSKTDYGAIAYALATVAFCQALSMLGMRSTLTRYVPIYHERGEHEKVFGILTLAVTTTVTVGLAMIALFALWPHGLDRLVNGDSTPIKLVVILAYTIPLQALDVLLINLFAVFGKTRAIFLRKFVVTPALKLGIVLILIATGSDVVVLAYGYLAGGVVALSFSLWGAASVLRQEGLLKDLRPTLGGVSVAEAYRFSVSILIHEVVPPLMHSVNVFILGYFYGTAEVAVYTVILPAARLNRLVVDNFQVLYLPMAARLFARNDGPGLNDLYWQTTIWMTLASFPIFAMTFVFAGPLTEKLYGVEYASSSAILMLLAAGYYLDVALGCNGQTLRVAGRVRYLLGVDVTTAAVNILANLVLIRSYGALGAGIAAAATLLLHAMLRQVGLSKIAGLRLFDARCGAVYPAIALCTFLLAVARWLSSPNFYVLVFLVIVASATLFVVTLRHLSLGTVFPELAKVPVIRQLVT